MLPVKINNEELKRLLEKGLDLSFKKLVKSKQQTDGILLFSENDKIIRVKARDIKI